LLAKSFPNCLREYAITAQHIRGEISAVGQKWGIVAVSGMRILACAGALTAGLLLGVVGGGIATADDGGESQGSSGASDSSNDDSADQSTGLGEPDGSVGVNGGASDPPESSVGSGRDDNVGTREPEKPTREEPKKSDRNRRFELPQPLFKHSFLIPILSAPEPTKGSPPAPYWTTIAVPVPSIDGALGYLQPEPEPEPGPAFRGQEEEPVISATGGGSETAPGTDPQPPVLQAPVVVAPPVRGAAPAAAPAAAPSAASTTSSALGNPGGAVPRMTAAAPPAGATVRAATASGDPLPPKAIIPMRGQPTTRLGIPQYLRPATVAELATAALPGIAGLVFLTTGGGVIGYRQANAGRYLRLDTTARFLP
jgi:hypothetical protein